MGTEPTFTPDALTERQLDGIACVVCGDVFQPGTRSVPVGEALGAQVFACVGCVEYRCSHCGEQGALTDPDGAGDGDHYCGDCGTPINVRADVVFACASHAADEQGARFVSTPGDDDATAGKSATWPDGEPASVRDMARRHDLARRADNLVGELEHDFKDVRDERLAAAVQETIEALRELSDACPAADEEMIWRTAVHAHAALTRCALLVAEVERRTR